ncbi:MAG: hypothetical protein M3680_25785, partial [Myxococcota bacterium]|nr:hypothetical protein [Myxococcota bacterium]
MLDGVLRYGIAGLRRDGTWAVALHEVGALISAASRSRARPALRPLPAVVALSVLPSAPIVAAGRGHDDELDADGDAADDDDAS